ncbi:MAG: hypothetical protein HYX75_07450 [Acidobacteria bacterium]|nr:hypothetical protein [Acidobacteriota bacterium]
MRKILSALTVGAVLLISAAASETAEKQYIPLLVDTAGTRTFDLYWMKLNSNGSIAKGPVLVRDSASGILSAAIVPQGNKILYAEGSGIANQIYSVGVNPQNGTVVNGPTQLTTGSTGYFYYGLSIAKDGRKLAYGRNKGESTDFDVFLKRFKPNGSLKPSTVTIAATGAQELGSMITEDGLGVYYSSDFSGPEAILFQKLKSWGKPSGTPITVVTYPMVFVKSPRVDAKREWMSYILGNDIWVTRLAATGAATGTPVKGTSSALGYSVVGGLTRDARLLVYTVVWGGAGLSTFTLYSQRLDASGNPTGAPVVLIPTSTTSVFPWMVDD